MSSIGHNHPPREEALTPAKKVERILSLLDRQDLTSAQKCVGVKIIGEADRDGVAKVRTPELQRAASARDRETVFRATKALGAAGIEKASGLGQAGRYTVLPERVISAVIEAYEQNKTGRHEPDQSTQKRSGQTGRDENYNPVGMIPTGPSEPVGLNGTGRDEPVGMNQTGRDEPDQSKSRACTRIETPSGLLPLENNITPIPPKIRKLSDAQKALDAFTAYNDTALKCGLPQAVKLTPDRQRKILARLRDYGMDGWCRALANLEMSGFLTGQNDSGWRADLDFVCQARSFGKLHDGGYGNGRHRTSDGPTEPAYEIDYEALRRESGIVVYRGRDG